MGMGSTLAEALLKGHTHTEAAGLRSCVASRHAENLWGHAAESVRPQALPKAMHTKGAEPLPPRGIAAGIGLHLAEALRKGHTHTEATGLRSCVASRLL